MSHLPEPLRSARPVHVAPMAGGPSTPVLAIAAARAGHFAQLAAGYRTADDLAAQIAEVRAAVGDRFGVNLFAPNPVPIAQTDYDDYRERLRPVADRLGVGELPPRREDDDAWDEKVAMLLDDPVPVVSFTFGLPSPGLVAAFRERGTVTMQSVTSVAEARRAAARGVDVLVVQGFAAGGHSAVLDPVRGPDDVPLADLVRDVVAAVDLPVVAGGGIGGAEDAGPVVDAGADAVMVGTLVLRADEAGTSSTHRAALADPAFTATIITRAFTGRPARALVTPFVTAHADAPLGYPALHHLTRPIRTAAAAAGDPSALHLWVGTGWRRAAARPVAEILTDVADGLEARLG
jgi:nitronate monooxygenase